VKIPLFGDYWLQKWRESLERKYFEKIGEAKAPFGACSFDA
jgi:hypothetical protein